MRERWLRALRNRLTRRSANKKTKKPYEKCRRIYGLGTRKSHFGSFEMLASDRDVQTITRRLDLTGATRNMGTRRLLKEGILFKAKSGRKLRGFLCTDILLLTDESIKSLYRLVGLALYDYDLCFLTSIQPIQLAYAHAKESSRSKVGGACTVHYPMI